ncbi:hypothetical protein ACHAW6_000670, partial [Cyclotella cf. meneghiniana]
NELPTVDVEDVLLAVLNRYARYRPKDDDENPGEALQVLGEERQEAIQIWTEEVLSLGEKQEDDDDKEEDLQSGVGSRFFHHFVQPPIDYEQE